MLDCKVLGSKCVSTLDSNGSGYSETHFGHQCPTFDYLDINIVVDRRFYDYSIKTLSYIGPHRRTQEVFASAQEIYWKQACVLLRMNSYQQTYISAFTPPCFSEYCGDDPNWPGFDAVAVDGVNSSTLLNTLRSTVLKYQPDAHYHAFHLFSGATFGDGPIGLAFSAWEACIPSTPLRRTKLAFGVNQISASSLLFLQAMLFAHELGHK